VFWTRTRRDARRQKVLDELLELDPAERRGRLDIAVAAGDVRRSEVEEALRLIQRLDGLRVMTVPSAGRLPGGYLAAGEHEGVDDVAGEVLLAGDDFDLVSTAGLRDIGIVADQTRATGNAGAVRRIRRPARHRKHAGSPAARVRPRRVDVQTLQVASLLAAPISEPMLRRTSPVLPIDPLPESPAQESRPSIAWLRPESPLPFRP
jgi:hypothetical protein